MSRELPRSSRISGTGSCFPDRVLTNADLEKMVETSDEWITSRTGIHERRIVAPDQACSDLALVAAQRALEMAKVAPKDLDGVIVGTVTGDMQFPATATLVQDRLGAVNATAFDISAACSGFIYGSTLAHALICSGQMKRVVVVGAEVLTKFIDFTDRSTCVLFGDGAGAVVMEACAPGEGILSTYTRSDGSLAELLCIRAGGSRMPFGAHTAAERLQYIKMKGDGVYKWAVRAMADASRVVLQEAGRTMDDVALVIPHQANIRIIEAVCERLEVPMDKVIINLDRRGNTSSATIPTAFDETVRSGRVKEGDLVVFTGFGGGFTWGAILFRHSIPA